MQFRHFFSLFGMPFLFLFCFTQNGSAQEVSTNSSGDKIVVFEDGSWRYFNPETDQFLENPQAQATPVSGQVDDLEKGKKSKKVKNGKVKAKKVKKEKAPKVKNNKPKKKKKNKADKKKKVNKKAKKKKGKAKKSDKKSKGKKIVKAEVSPEVLRESEQLAARRAERAAAESAKAHRIYEDISLERVFLEKELQDAYASLASTDSDIAVIESKLQTVRTQEQTALTNYSEAEVLSDEYEKMVHMPYQKREKLLAKMKMESEADKSGVLTTSTGEVDKGMTKEERKKSSEMKVQREKMDVILFPPSPPCKLVFDGLDEFSGKIRRDLAKELFFSYTNEKMRPYFKDRDFITCEGNLTSLSGGVYFLNLELEIASENAQRDYGFLEKGAVMVVKMIDGTTVRIINRKTDMGTLNPLQSSVIYKPQYLIGSNQVKDLSKGEVDRVRLVWSSGYEDYEIFELDFLINQFRCLEVK